MKCWPTASRRLKSDPPLDGPLSEAELFAQVGNTITAKGLGGKEALDVFTSVFSKGVYLNGSPTQFSFHSIGTK